MTRSSKSDSNEERPEVEEGPWDGGEGKDVTELPYDARKGSGGGIASDVGNGFC